MILLCSYDCSLDCGELIHSLPQAHTAGTGHQSLQSSLPLKGYSTDFTYQHQFTCITMSSPASEIEKITLMIGLVY